MPVVVSSAGSGLYSAGSGLYSAGSGPSLVRVVVYSGGCGL